MSTFRWTRRDALKGSLTALAATGVPRWRCDESTVLSSPPRQPV